MKRSIFLLMLIALFHSCREKAIDPSRLVRPVALKISVANDAYQLSWEEIRIVCITSPCPDVANTEAEEYEVQIASEELGPFHTYQTVGASQKSIRIPAAGKTGQLVARIVSKAKGAPPVNSGPVMATIGFVSQSAYYPGFGTRGEAVVNGDVTKDGSRATYTFVSEESPDKYVLSVYLSELVNEQPVATKLIQKNASGGKLSPDGQQVVYFPVGGTELVIYDIATARERILPITNVPPIRGLDWSPDGRWLVINTMSDVESRLWKIAVAGGDPVPLTPPMPIRELNNIRPGDIDWSPDGRHIAVSRARAEPDGKQWRAVISLYSADGTGEAKFFETQPSWADTAPSFSPDGKQLAFLSTRTSPSVGPYSLWVRDLTTGQPRQILLLPGLLPSDDFAPRCKESRGILRCFCERGEAG
ncbi:MAG: TolB family protein [Dyadobacter fermentans]